MNAQTTLRQFLRAQPEAVPNIAAAVDDIAQATRKISYFVSRGELGSVLGSAHSDNGQGEAHKRLDVISNEAMIDSLAWTGHWAGLASEEMPHSMPANGAGGYLCLFDPLDGASNIDIDGSVGTIFSILRCPPGVTTPADVDFLQAGTKQVAAGFVLYGPATVMVLTTGRGVQVFTLDRGSGEYMLTRKKMTIPPHTEDFTINMANRRYWAAPMRAYIDECMRGTDSARGKHFNMRWVGSMVADVYRVLCEGGVFLYPWDRRDPALPGKLRLMFEANPMSFIVEQAGGRSSTGLRRIMEIEPAHLHERCPVVMGSRDEVERVLEHHRGSIAAV